MVKKGKPVKEKNQGPVNYISLSTSWEVWLIKLNTTLSIYFQKLEETTAKFLLLSVSYQMGQSIQERTK